MPVESVLSRGLLCFVACGALVGPSSAWAQCEAGQLTAPGGEGGNDFARGVAIDGDVAVVGDPVIEAVYVFRRGGGGPGDWVLEQVLTPPEPEVADQFGRVAIDGEVILVGAPGAAVPEFNRGAGYVYRYDPQAGQWRFEQQLLASDGEAGDKFGWSVAIDGNVALLGARDDENNGEREAGSAYIFRYEPRTKQWIEETKLTDADVDFNDSFGFSVSIRENVALIGEPGDDASGPQAGAAFILRFDGSKWNQEAQLTAFDGEAGDLFGWSVSLANDVALIGARDAENNLGAAYVFRYDGKDWRHEAKLIASDPVGPSGPLFGVSVAISADATTAVIGALLDGESGFEAGAAHVFRRDPSVALASGRWREVAKLTASNGGGGDFFGRSVATSGAIALVGAPRWSEVPGRSYVFNLDPIPGDLDCDGTVGVVDLLLLLAAWGPCADCDTPLECTADLNGDCTVGVSDLLILLGNWG